MAKKQKEQQQIKKEEVEEKEIEKKMKSPEDDVEEIKEGLEEKEEEKESTSMEREVSEEEEAVEEVEKESGLPMAPIVRIMKEELDKDKMIRSRVKIEMNKWLVGLCRRIARRMNRSQYTVIELSDFRTAIEPYETIDDIEIEKERIIATMEKIKYDCDSLIRDVQRKFIAPTKDEELQEKEVKEEPQ